MVIDKTKINGIYYLNKNNELHFRGFELTNPTIDDIGEIEHFQATPNEDYIIVGVFISGFNSAHYNESTELDYVYYKNCIRQLSPIENFLCIPHTNSYFKVNDCNYRTENEPFIIRISKTDSSFY